MKAEKIYEVLFGSKPKKEKITIIKGLNESLNLLKVKGYNEGILEEVGKVLKKHGANTILTMVVLNFFRKLFGRNSLIIRNSVIKTPKGYPKRIFQLYDNNRLVYSHEDMDIVLEKKLELEETKDSQKKITNYEEKKMFKEGIIFVDGKNIQVEFSKTGKRAFDDKGKEYEMVNGEWLEKPKGGMESVRKTKFIRESVEVSFDNVDKKEQERMRQFIDSRYPQATEEFKAKMFLTALERKSKKYGSESLTENKTNEQIWLDRIVNTDAQDIVELHDIMKVLHRNNKLSTMRMEELRQINGQEIKDALIDLLSDYEESGLNTTNTGSLIGQKIIKKE
jgi:hypothetical protein